MDFKIENNTLTVSLYPRVDTSNAEEVSAKIGEICAANPAENLVFDAEKMEYISSAGLRVILKYRKQNPTLKVVNVCSEVYDIFDMTGFTEMIPVEKAYRKLSVDGCPVIGKGAKGVVYRYDEEIIVKVYKNSDCLPDIKRERELARRAFVLGIPTAISYDIVKVGEQFGSVFELLNAKSYTKMIAEDEQNRDRYIADYAALLRKIHQTTVKAEDMPDIKQESIYKWVDAVKPFIPAEDSAKLKALVDAVPDTLNMLHCDYHTNNVMMQNGEALLIDMDTLAHGHPVFELANVFITYVGFGEVYPPMVENFLGIPYDLSKYIWKKFLPAYLGTDDQARINEVENKAKLLCYARLLRHTLRHGNPDSAEGKQTIELCRTRIPELLKVVDTLSF